MKLSNIEFFISSLAFLFFQVTKCSLFAVFCRKPLPNLPVEDYGIVVFFVDVIVILQYLKLDEVVLCIKFDSRLIILCYVEIYR